MVAAFDHGLSHKHPVERISMDQWKGIDCDSMDALDREFHVAIVAEPTAEQVEIDMEILSLQSLVDRDFLQTRGAGKQLVSLVHDQSLRLRGQFRKLIRQPQENMGIYEDFPAPPPKRASISLRPSSSKSSGTLKQPLRKPIRHCCPADSASWGDTLTSGLPALAMMKLSPPARRIYQAGQMGLGLVDIE
ncbi:MAG: hypothetical protein ACOYM2_04610 [Rectinemataceae bacterium]